MSISDTVQSQRRRPVETFDQELHSKINQENFKKTWDTNKLRYRIVAASILVIKQIRLSAEDEEL